MVEEKHQVRILLSKVQEDQEMSVAAVISLVKTQAIDQNLEGLEQVKARVSKQSEVSSFYDD